MIASLITCCLLSTAAATDLAQRRIYRPWSAIALTSGLALVLLTDQLSHLPMALLLFVATWALWHNGGIGGGDVWLATYLGLALGFEALLALLVGSLVGAVIAVALMAARRLSWRDPMPIGFFWALGGLVTLGIGWRIWPG
jgi:Flp pilus assembly protein protease CpaA